MPKSRTEMLAISFAGGQATRKKYAGTDYYRVIGAKGGRGGRGTKKPRRTGERSQTLEKASRKIAAATMAEILADLDGAE